MPRYNNPAARNRRILAIVLGTGWVPHRRGSLHYADDRGPKDVLHVLTDLTERLGRRFELCAEWRKRDCDSQTRNE